MTSRITRSGPHPVQLRLLTVRHVTDLTPRLRRVTLTGSALVGFESLGADDHVKLFLPGPDEREPTLPVMTPDGPRLPDGVTPPARRDYTPRAYRPDVQELDIDVVLHGSGPGATWAANVRPGDRVGVGGPRGSTIVRYDFDWYLLGGDESALPSVARRLEELPAGTRAIVLLEVQDATDELPLVSRADVIVWWLHRGSAEPGTTSLLLDAVEALNLPEGEGFVWFGAESAAAAALRGHLEARGQPRVWTRVVGYWKRGVAGHEEPKTAAVDTAASGR
ncbi:siderophore-interacting protein [Deinococcus pimensis]|uniref:siderophore-interacting protein n=1 Tax=Deinococcus pimensis TaxID=309888 RepID=UPI0005EB5110|nr:siderophore-interacting protein [Deinococcus pimensis]